LQIRAQSVPYRLRRDAVTLERPASRTPGPFPRTGPELNLRVVRRLD